MSLKNSDWISRKTDW